MTSPVISVVLAVHNDARFLREAVESVFAQTFSDFELLAIDDGSTDSSGQYLDSLNDPRIRVIHNNRNIGLTASLNIGLGASRGRYIARMDADDICEPTRFQRQAEFLDAHPETGILGSSRRVIDENGNDLHIARATEGDFAIRWKCLLGNPFAHPTVVLRKSVLDQHNLRYDEAFRTSQDYELWTRLLQHTHGKNLAEPLLRYRIRDGISRLSKAEQLANHDRIALAACRRLLPQFQLSQDQIRQLRGRFGGYSVHEPDMNPWDRQWIDTYHRMLDAFAIAHVEAPELAPFIAAERLRIETKAQEILAMRSPRALIVIMPDPIIDDGGPEKFPPHLDLNYRNAHDDQPEKNRAIQIAIGAGFLAALTVFGLVASWVMENLELGPTQHPQSPLHWQFSGPLTLGAVILWSWLLYFRPRSRWFILGALIGFGIGILIEGTCFVAIR